MYSINIEFHKEGNRVGFFTLKQDEKLECIVDRFTQVVSNYRVNKELGIKPTIYLENDKITDYDYSFISLDNEDEEMTVSMFSINFGGCN